jgi:hypothetical protein
MPKGVSWWHGTLDDGNGDEPQERQKDRGTGMVSKTFVSAVDPHAELHRDHGTGIAWIKDGSTGLGHSCHPNIDASGSVRGMKARGYWDEDDRTVRSHGFIYNVDHVVASDRYDRLALQECKCIGCLQRREWERP